MPTSKETGICAEYSDFSDVFSLGFMVELPEHTGIDDHYITLLENK